MINNSDKAAQQVILEKLANGRDAAFAQDLPESSRSRIDALEIMNRTAVNRSYREIPAKGMGGKLGRIVKRIMRRLTFWYVEPCMMQQTQYNDAAASFAAQTNSELNRLNLAEQENVRVREEIDELGRSFEGYAGRTDDLDARLRHIEKIIDDSKLIELMKIDGIMKTSFSQSGEDDICRFILQELHVPPKERTYLDLGANHAKLLSNTYSFYLDGARGVLVEANPVLCDELRRERPGDKVVSCCISEKETDTLEFYILNGDGLSTMDYDAAMSFVEANPNLRIEQTITVPAKTIGSIIKENFPDKAPAVMDVDVEGMELAILRQIDFDSFRPIIIICEMIDYSKELGIKEKNREIMDFMTAHGYREYAFTGINSVFLDEKAAGRNEK